jgi:predicted ABC-type ATPase
VRPFIIVLAGVNGAGKSSVLSALLLDEGLAQYNPDKYAAELVRELGFALDEANGRAWKHGKFLLERAIASGSNHAFETTLGGNTIARLLRKASKTHDVLMLYCGLDSPELHIARVAQRVAHKGHPIPGEKIRERWNTSRADLVKLLPVLWRLQVLAWRRRFSDSARAPRTHKAHTAPAASHRRPPPPGR